MFRFSNKLPVKFSDPIIQLMKEEEFHSELSSILTNRQLQLIYKQKWFKMYVPEELGGLNLDLIKVLELQESLAYWDGSLAWTVTLCSGATYFIGFIDPTYHQELFFDEKTCWGGSGMSTGIADWQGSYYRVNGIWKYATGSFHNTAFTANCQLYENGNPKLSSDGSIMTKSFYFKPEEVEVIEDWDMMGLRSTASHSFKVENLRVGENRTYTIDPAFKTLDFPIFKIPFMAFAELTLAANYMGMFKRLLDETYEIVLKKSNGLIPQDLQDVQKFLVEQTDLFYKTSCKLWEECIEEKSISSDISHKIHVLTHKTVQDGLKYAQLVYMHSGIEGARNHTDINRVWRNLNTASQHIMFRKK